MYLARRLGAGCVRPRSHLQTLRMQCRGWSSMEDNKGDKSALQPPSIDVPTSQDIRQTIEAAEKQARKKQVESARVQHMPIRAVHLARRFDIISLFEGLFPDRSKVSHFFHQDSVVLHVRGEPHVDSSVVKSSPFDDPDDSNVLNVAGNLQSRRAGDKWIVYFDYGACVFFNCDEPLVNKLVRHSTRYGSGVLDMRGHEEQMLLVNNPKLNTWSKLTDKHILVRETDHINVHVIAGVLAQTVALEYYERQIEGILHEFEKLNTSVERKGPEGALFGLWLAGKQSEAQQQRKLFKIVATNNTLLIDLVSKLRVIDRKRPGEAAWSYTRYHNMWETLSDEFELNERFNNLNFKLDLIQHNTKFFLEVLGTHRGERMEWYIIVLIAAELALGVYELFLKLKEEKADKQDDVKVQAA